MRALFQKRLGLPSRVAADVLIISITGPDGDQDRRCVRAGDGQAAVGGPYLPTLGLYARQGLELHRTRSGSRRGAGPFQDQCLGAFRADGGLLGTGEGGGKGDLPRLICRETEHDHLIGGADECLAGIVDAVGRVEVVTMAVSRSSWRR